ncbi:hypothetical protein V8C43DRAFT_133369 [Trichoderma afarasin]
MLPAQVPACMSRPCLCTTLSSPCQTKPEYLAEMGKTPANSPPTARKELQPQPGLQPQSGPLASEAFLDRQRTGGLWTQRAQQLRNPGKPGIWPLLEQAALLQTLQLGRLATTDGQREAPFACTVLDLDRLSLQQRLWRLLRPDTLGSRPWPPSTLIIVLSCTSTAGPLRLVIPASHLSAPLVWARPERAGLDWTGLAWTGSLPLRLESSLPVCTCRLLRHSHPRARSFASAPSETLLGAFDPVETRPACLCLSLAGPRALTCATHPPVLHVQAQRCMYEYDTLPQPWRRPL